jgi:hypothetical protein
LPTQSRVKLNVYNSIGQIVETVLDKTMDAGYHEIEFNAAHLPSGVYLYRLEADGFSSVKKMLLLK